MVHLARQVGFYALLGAAAFLGGLMRMSAAQALILMEMTQAPAMLPFLMLVSRATTCMQLGLLSLITHMGLVPHSNHVSKDYLQPHILAVREF